MKENLFRNVYYSENFYTFAEILLNFEKWGFIEQNEQIFRDIFFGTIEVEFCEIVHFSEEVETT